jgi:hypothetical protein
VRMTCLVALALYPLLAGGAHAGPLEIGAFSAVEPAKTHSPKLNLRLVEDAEPDPAPIHHSGMIAQSQIAPNATLGIGILKAFPKKLGSGDWRPEQGAPQSRKAAVTFRLKF